MSITTGKVKAVKLEMRRLTESLKELESNAEINYTDKYWSPKHTGAVRRASMDLTRALAELRKQ